MMSIFIGGSVKNYRINRLPLWIILAGTIVSVVLFVLTRYSIDAYAEVINDSQTVIEEQAGTDTEAVITDEEDEAELEATSVVEENVVNIEEEPTALAAAPEDKLPYLYWIWCVVGTLLALSAVLFMVGANRRKEDSNR